MLRSSIVSKPGLLTTMQQEVGTAQPGSCRHIWAASQFRPSRPYCRICVTASGQSFISVASQSSVSVGPFEWVYWVRRKATRLAMSSSLNKRANDLGIESR
jgi:hypothetical protein